MYILDHAAENIPKQQQHDQEGGFIQPGSCDPPELVRGCDGGELKQQNIGVGRKHVVEGGGENQPANQHATHKRDLSEGGRKRAHYIIL